MRIHMIAACGTGMGALACMLKEMGHEVTGSDDNVYPPMSDFLREKDILIFKGFKASNLTGNPELVIIGNAVSRGNEEVEAVIDKALPYCSMPQALNRFAADGKKIILVTGTHGKTTTSSIMAHVLFEAGLDPSFMIGGILKNFNSNYRIGNGEYIVIEGDEYDTAFFDKGPKFMHYIPSVAIMTGIEFDHADIFRDIDHIKDAFRGLLGNIPMDSLVLACDGDENLKDVLKSAQCKVEYYGKNAYHWGCDNFSVKNKSTHINLNPPGKDHLEIISPLMGMHNVLNVISVVAAAKKLGISDDSIQKALNSFSGVKRRQEIRGVKNGITVMDDFAHHPTAVRETIAAVKPFFTRGRIIALFEPRTNSSMRDIFHGQYSSSFDDADIICIRKPSMLDKIPVEHRLQADRLVFDIANRGKDAHYFQDTDEIVRFMKKKAKPGDLLLVMSNGGFDNIHEHLLEEL